MNKYVFITKHTILLCLLFCIVSPLRADGLDVDRPRYNTNTIIPDDMTTWTGRMQKTMDSLINLPIFETTQLGLYVFDLTTGRDLVCVNHRHRMRPASCQKLVTAITALGTMGANYQLSTRMALTGEVRDSTLWGDITIIGGMDPLLSQNEVEQMAQLLGEAGIDSIAGVLRIDLSMKNEDELGWGWCWDDKTVPLLPLMVEKRDRFVTLFLSSLQSKGIRGLSIDRVVQDYCPPNARMFCEAHHTVEQVLQPMMKRSDNFFAESLFYQIAAFGGHRPAGRKDATAYTDVIIRSIGLTPSEYQIADGSGLSLYNYVSPELLVRLLQYAWQQEPMRSVLYASLPIAGVDGTLEKRMKKTAAENNVHAKTGTVEGISSLSGYCTSPEGHTLAFSIINQGIRKTATGRDWQDKVCEALCK